MLKLQMIGAAVLLLGMCYIIRLTRKKRMELKYALPWLAVSLAALIVDCFPKLLSALADLLGVATPVNALYLIAFLFSVCLLFALTVIVSRQSERIRQLAQAAALCEERVRQLEGARKEGQSQIGSESRSETGLESEIQSGSESGSRNGLESHIGSKSGSRNGSESQSAAERAVISE